MSQKRAKLLRKYTKVLGLNGKGTVTPMPTPNNPNGVVVSSYEKVIKHAYAESNWIDKTEAAREAKDVINLSKTNAKI